MAVRKGKVRFDYWPEAGMSSEFDVSIVDDQYAHDKGHQLRIFPLDPRLGLNSKETVFPLTIDPFRFLMKCADNGLDTDSASEKVTFMPAGETMVVLGGETFKAVHDACLDAVNSKGEAENIMEVIKWR